MIGGNGYLLVASAQAVNSILHQQEIRRPKKVHNSDPDLENRLQVSRYRRFFCGKPITRVVTQPATTFLSHRLTRSNVELPRPDCFIRT